MKSIDELVKLIRKDFDAGNFDKFIHDATFPNFKKISPGTKLKFRFPVTLLVGPNGGGKSTILHGLWGMPLGYSTSRFWFSTAVDPIAEHQNGKYSVPRYWYSHYISELDAIVQTRKVKGTKRNGYWEPSKPSTGDGMEPISSGDKSEFRSTDRWTPVKREVEYINTKAETNAFDRFFYRTTVDTLQDRQERFQKEASRLRQVIDYNLQSKVINRGEFVFANDFIPKATLEIINRILGKQYVSARYILHRFYDRNQAPSVIFETKSHTYSESFAGSGELSVVNLVLQIQALKPYALLLLDEPETSLHPGAQRELINYILQCTYDKKLQVVISTHSPTLVDLVPDDALVVLDHDEFGATARYDVHKSAAFYRLGHRDPEKISILTEDVLLKAMVERALRLLDESLQKKCQVIAVSLGVSEMLSHQVQTLMMTGAKALMVLDGDQKTFLDAISVDLSALSEKDKSALMEKLESLNVSMVGLEPDLEGYVEWCKRRVVLINETCPEQVFLKMLEPSHPKLGSASNKEYKKYLKSKLKSRGDETDSHSMTATFKFKLGECIDQDSEIRASLNSLASRLKVAIKNVGI